MSIEKLVEQDFQALEHSASRNERLSKTALKRILENIDQLDNADRMFHWHEELRRIGALPPVEAAPSAAVQGTDVPPETEPTLIMEVPESDIPTVQDLAETSPNAEAPAAN